MALGRLLLIGVRSWLFGVRRFCVFGVVLGWLYHGVDIVVSCLQAFGFGGYLCM